MNFVEVILIKLPKLALYTSILIVLTIGLKLDSGYYNKIFESRNVKLLSNEYISLIILITTGDTRYETEFLKSLFKELNIIHLLVLSGSNLVIFIQFFSIFESRNSKSFFVIKSIVVLSYLRYTNFLHPLARAFIFMLLYDFIKINGFKAEFKAYFLTLLSISILIAWYLNFSYSFLISMIFAISILAYNELTLRLSLHSHPASFFIFHIYMSIFSSFVTIIFFNDSNFLRTLLSNILIVSLFDFFVLIFYSYYFLSFTNLAGYLSPFIEPILRILLEYMTSLLYFYKIYNI